MFKPTAPLQRNLRRLALTTKMAGKDYYKGTRSGSMGDHTKHGRYLINWNKVRTYRVPEDLSRCTLTPFVATRVERAKGKFTGTRGPIDGAAYLERWKMENGRD
ncbi:50S ribosomal protein-like protein YmL27 [Lepidopterella palustris CBS 459.81]|uniref:50S ribosomal protein-like protein YmL27 n=1 Tax=Lepidopterella palustris CBS 459.81 TaxID=1314670 RepID=A0A8E2E075_9PEZI|nr:50S ribosomal protein-like protein YmL27 [Lepidopterella palustris CBS 459.81]